MSMITATAWVPRGFAAPFPTKYTLDEEEFKRISELAKLQLGNAEDDLESAQQGTETEDAMTDGVGSDIDESAELIRSKA